MRAVVLACGLMLAATPLLADARVTVLMDALRMPDLIAALRGEGLSDAGDLNTDMLQGQGGAFWEEQVSRLYDTTRMEDAFYTALHDGLEDEALDAVLQFFDSRRGNRITDLEVAARRAMMDEALRDVAAEAHANLPENDPHGALVQAFIASNDLLELNVALTMSTSYRFSRGLVDGGLLQMTDAQILEQVWASENDLRVEAQTWLSGYFLMAQQPLPLADLEAYVAFADSPEGAALNAALFQGYEVIFTDVAYGLGRAVALSAVGNDI